MPRAPTFASESKRRKRTLYIYYFFLYSAVQVFPRRFFFFVTIFLQRTTSLSLPFARSLNYIHLLSHWISFLSLILNKLRLSSSSTFSHSFVFSILFFRSFLASWALYTFFNSLISLQFYFLPSRIPNNCILIYSRVRLLMLLYFCCLRFQRF